MVEHKNGQALVKIFPCVLIWVSFVEKIWHDLALEWCFTISGLDMNYAKGFRIIPYYY